MAGNTDYDRLIERGDMEAFINAVGSRDAALSYINETYAADSMIASQMREEALRAFSDYAKDHPEEKPVFEIEAMEEQPAPAPTLENTNVVAEPGATPELTPDPAQEPVVEPATTPQPTPALTEPFLGVSPQTEEEQPAPADENEDDDRSFLPWQKRYSKSFKHGAGQYDYALDVTSQEGAANLDLDVKKGGSSIAKVRFEQEDKVGLAITSQEGANFTVNHFMRLGYKNINLEDKPGAAPMDKNYKAMMIIAAMNEGAEIYFDKRPIKFEDLGIEDATLKANYEKAKKKDIENAERANKIAELRKRVEKTPLSPIAPQRGETEEQAEQRRQETVAQRKQREEELQTIKKNLEEKAINTIEALPETDPKRQAYDAKLAEAKQIRDGSGLMDANIQAQIDEKEKEAQALALQTLSKTEKATYEAANVELSDIDSRKTGEELREAQRQFILKGAGNLMGEEKDIYNAKVKRAVELDHAAYGYKDPVDPSKNVEQRALTEAETAERTQVKKDSKEIALNALPSYDREDYQKNAKLIKTRVKAAQESQKLAQDRFRQER